MAAHKSVPNIVRSQVSFSATEFSGLELMSEESKGSGNGSVVFIKKQTAGFSVSKTKKKQKKIFQTVIDKRYKSQQGTTDVGAYIDILEQYILPGNFCYRERSGYFSRTMTGLILHVIIAWFRRNRVSLTGLPAVQICLPLKMYSAS